MSDIVKTAVRGTRQSNIETLLPSIKHLKLRDGQSVESQLLLQVGMLAMQRRAGFIPATIDAAPQELICIDSAVVCDERVIRLLPMLLQDNLRNLLNILINKLYNSGLRLPDEWLPLILNMRDKRLRYAMTGRSQWLAQIANKPEWQWVLENSIVRFTMPDPDWRYQTSIWGQLIAFRRLRQKMPLLARQQLSEKWHSLDIHYQADFVYNLAYRLSMEDEPFLWDLYCQSVTCAEDAAVKFAAAFLMSQLPKSRFIRTVVSTMLDIFTFEYRPVDKQHNIRWNQELLQQQCEQYQTLFQTDLKKVDGQNSLGDLFALIPSSWWYQKNHLTTHQLIEIAVSRPNANAVFLRCWQRRATIDSDTNMAYALLKYFIERNQDKEVVTFYHSLHREMWLFQNPVNWVQRSFRRASVPDEMQALFNLLTWEQFITFFTRWLELTAAYRK